MTGTASRSRWDWLGTPTTMRGRIASGVGVTLAFAATYVPTVVFDLGLVAAYAIFVPLCIPVFVIVHRIDKRTAQTYPAARVGRGGTDAP